MILDQPSQINKNLQQNQKSNQEYSDELKIKFQNKKSNNQNNNYYEFSQLMQSKVTLHNTNQEQSKSIQKNTSSIYQELKTITKFNTFKFQKEKNNKEKFEQKKFNQKVFQVNKFNSIINSQKKNQIYKKPLKIVGTKTFQNVNKKINQKQNSFIQQTNYYNKDFRYKTTFNNTSVKNVPQKQEQNLINKTYLNPQLLSKKKREDLLNTRNSQFLQSLKKNKTIFHIFQYQRHKKFQKTFNSSKNITYHQSLSPKVRQITQRLYFKNLSKLSDYKQKRQYFQNCINNLNLFHNYVNQSQSDNLFKSLLRSSLPITSWNNQIINFTHDKIKKIVVKNL